MSTPPRHTDFLLPGTAARGLERWTMRLAYAYSTKHNIRRVESLFYGVWDTVLDDLVFDMTPKVFVVPQLLLGTDHITSGLDPDASIVTAPQKDAKESTPDFALVEIQCRSPPNLSLTDVSNFAHVIITKARTPALVEVKRPPTRRPASLQVFISDVKSLLMAAQRGLGIQAIKAFDDQPETTCIVLIACSGVWWVWRCVTRENMKPMGAVVDADGYLFEEEESDDDSEVVAADCSSDEELEGESDEEFVPTGKDETPVMGPREIPKRKAGPRQTYTAEKEPPVTQADLVSYKPGKKGEGKKPSKRPIQYFTDLKEGMAAVKEDVNDAWPKAGQWSKALHLGSPASNQNMYLVYQKIQQERFT